MKIQIWGALICGAFVLPIPGWTQSPDDQDARMVELVQQAQAAQAKKEAAAAEEAAFRKEIDALSREMDGKPPIPPPPPPSDDAKDSLSDIAQKLNFKVRRSVTMGHALGLPALIQYTRPNEGADSYSVDAGISIGGDADFGINLPSTWSIFTEYHYNSSTSKPQDTFLAGGRLESIFPGGTAAVLNGTFKRDNEVAGEGGVVSFLIFPAIPKLKMGGFYWELGKIANGRMETYVGLEAENGNGATAAFKDGHRVSARAGLGLEMNLFPHHLGNRLQWTNSLDYWNHFDSNGLYNAYEDDQLYFVSSVQYWLDRPKGPDGILTDEEKHIGLTARYLNGDNPIEGAFDQNLWTFGISIFF